MEQQMADMQGQHSVSDDVDVSHWAVTAPFLTEPGMRWISDFVESDRHQFEVIPKAGAEVSWHTKKVARTGFGEWRDFSRTAARAMDYAVETNGGVITVFPQLAAAAATRKRLRRLDRPLVAWFFNTTFNRDARLLVARQTLSTVDRFVVHSSIEIEAYAEQLRLPAERFVFAAAQYGGKVQTQEEDQSEPFVLATGSGARDYRTFFEAMSMLDIPAKVVAGDRVLAGLTPPPNVEILSGVSGDEIKALMRKSRVNVIPMNGEGLTAGLVTIVLTFRHGRGIVVTDRPGIDDYVKPDDNSLVVPMSDPRAMADAIEAMYNDADLRDRLGQGAEAFAEAHCTDQAAAGALTRVLDAVVQA